MKSEISYEIVNSIDRFKSLRVEWNSLEAAQVSPLNRWEWFYSGALSFHRPNHLKILVLRKGEQIAALAPLVENAAPAKRHLTFIGFAALHEPCDLIYGDLGGIESLVKYLCDLGRPFYFERLPLESSTGQRINPILHNKGFVIQKSVASTCFLPMLQKSWEQYLAGLPSKKRYDLRRVYRRAEEAGPVHCEIITPDIAILPSLLDKVFSIEAQSWKRHAGSNILSNPRMESFLRSYCTFAAEGGYLRIALLSLQDTLVAGLIGVEFGNRFWVFKIGYDSQWSRYSPGILLINETIRYAFQNGLKAYEFMGADEPWIHLWTGKGNLHGHALIAFYPHNIQGAMRLTADAGKYLWRRISQVI